MIRNYKLKRLLKVLEQSNYESHKLTGAGTPRHNRLTVEWLPNERDRRLARILRTVIEDQEELEPKDKAFLFAHKDVLMDYWVRL